MLAQDFYDQASLQAQDFYAQAPVSFSRILSLCHLFRRLTIERFVFFVPIVFPFVR
jgi:hypothetical protein